MTRRIDPLPHPSCHPGASRQRLTKRLRTLALLAAGTTVIAGCGSEVTELGPGDGRAPSCEALAGAYQLDGANDDYYGAGPWVLLQSSTDSCQAVVASTGHLGQTYDVDITPTAVVLDPIGVAARGGWEGATEHALTDWNRVTLRHDGTVLTGTATAAVENRWNQEDIGGVDELTIELSVSPAGPGEMAWPARALPWRPVTVQVSQPVDALAGHLSLPSSHWSASDVTEVDTPGVIEAEVAYHGDWDAIRGQTVTLGTGAGLVDLAGAPVTASTAAIDIYEVGPAIVAHEMADTSTVASWGTVEPLAEGDCATLGCVLIHGQCGSYDGVAGQVDTAGKSEVILSMRLVANEEWTDQPTLYRIEVVTEDGESLEPVSGGQWTDEIEQEWVYSVAGHDKVGFAIEVSSYCHGWGGPIILDAVRAL